ncbi:hypothetical protein HGRIS_009573 [Hohenbuehelia grisea]|uniref:Uncharacterized protein n=1 Tax=Hohenbuehelia grisea TaxID=104357 RepID=A0ABR3J1K6_9AGAR
MASCVRRFGRPCKAPGESRRGPHVTGARMSAFNGHEVLLSYSSDAVYLYSTKDDPSETTDTPSTLLPPNPPPISIPIATSDADSASIPLLAEDGSANSREDSPDYQSMFTGDDSDDEMEFDGADEDRPDWRPNVPIVLPRRSFTGTCNVETVKDVNFMGPEDRYITSGSDEGHFFIWDKRTGDLRGLYEGDGSVVNVIESHPSLPLVAVSGIDSTVKLFAPSATGESAFSRMQNAQEIMAANLRKSNAPRVTLGRLISGRLANMLAAADGGDTRGPECTFQ